MVYYLSFFWFLLQPMIDKVIVFIANINIDIIIILTFHFLSLFYLFLYLLFIYLLYFTIGIEFMI